MVLPPGIIQKSQIDAVIADVCRQLAPDVVRIRYDLEPDWSGDDSISFRILVSDDAARTRLHETTKKTMSLLESILNLWGLGLLVYHRVRSVSEQAALREKSWD